MNLRFKMDWYSEEEKVTQEFRKALTSMLSHHQQKTFYTTIPIIILTLSNIQYINWHTKKYINIFFIKILTLIVTFELFMLCAISRKTVFICFKRFNFT